LRVGRPLMPGEIVGYRRREAGEEAGRGVQPIQAWLGSWIVLGDAASVLGGVARRPVCSGDQDDGAKVGKTCPKASSHGQRWGT